MNKAELVQAIADKTKASKSQVEAILNSTLDIIQTKVSQGQEVKLVGFGSFVKQTRKEKTGRNPKTGETHKIPSCSVPRFKAGKEFKEKVLKK